MKTLGMVLICALLLAAPTIGSAQEGITRFSLDNTKAWKVGAFPKGWRNWPTQGDEVEYVYKVGAEGNRRFIRAMDDKGYSVQIFRNFDWPVAKRPMLSWSWRAMTLPEGAAENNDATNDSACGVYVVVGKWQGHAIKYVWSTTLAPGTVVTRRGGKLKIKVLDSGAAQKGQWIAHTVDVVSDYEQLFGRKLERNPSGVGILTDGNAVHKTAACDYKNFAVSVKKP